GGPPPPAGTRRAAGAERAPAERAEKDAEAEDDRTVELQSIAEGKEDGRKRLARMKPEERRALLAEVKMAPELRGLPALFKKEGVNGSLAKTGAPAVEKGRVTVQIWLNQMPAGGLKQLKALGFVLAAELRPKQ